MIIVLKPNATKEDADEILVMDDGRCVQRGQHTDLMRSDGPYRDLWAAERQGHLDAL